MFAFRRSQNTLRIHENRKRMTLTDYHSVEDLYGTFSHSKAFHFFSFLSLHKCRKSLSKTTSMSLN